MSLLWRMQTGLKDYKTSEVCASSFNGSNISLELTTYYRATGETSEPSLGLNESWRIARNSDFVCVRERERQRIYIYSEVVLNQFPTCLLSQGLSLN